MMKKAQTASGAAAVIGILAGFIVLYFLLIPPDVREELLGLNESVEEENGEKEALSADVLLFESPGTISEQKKGEYEHNIDSFNLFTRAEDIILKDVGSFYIESSRGSKEIKEVILVIDSPENTENIKLSFNAGSHKNRLLISLNDVELFNNEVSGFKQIALDSAEKENILKFYSPELSWYNLFGKNFYELSEVKITATVENVANRESTQAFFIGSSEHKDIEEAYLRYFVECRPVNVGLLKIYINELQLSSKVPDCGSAAKTTIDPGYLVSGTNTLRFYAETGSYLIDQIAVKTKLKEALYPTYYFEINETQWKWIGENKKEVKLSMEFAAVGEVKRAELEINGHKSMIDTTEDSYNKTINKNHLREKNNYLKIIPEGTIEILELKIRLK